MGNYKEILRLIKVRFFERSIAFVYATVIGTFVASKGIPDIRLLFYALLVIFCLAVGTYIFNDVQDCEVDRINKVDRPIAIGSVTRKQGLIVSIILFSFGLMLSALINLETLLTSLVITALGILYSVPPIRLRNRFLIVNIVRSSGGFLSSLLGGAVIGNISPQIIFQGFMFFMLIFSGTPIFDLPDLMGDKVGRSKSLSIVYGPKFGIKFSIAGWSVLTVLAILSFPYFGFNVITPIMLTSLLLIHIWLAYSLLSRWHDVNYCRDACKKIIHLGFFYQLSFLLGVLSLF